LQRILGSGLLGYQLFRGHFGHGGGWGLWGLFPGVESETFPAMRDGWLAKPHAYGKQVLKVTVGKIRVALSEIVDSLFHPVLLIVFLGLKDTTTIDVTEELVSSPGDHVFFGHDFLLL